jgi:hypothetical protein
MFYRAIFLLDDDLQFHSLPFVSLYLLYDLELLFLNFI